MKKITSKREQSPSSFEAMPSGSDLREAKITSKREQSPSSFEAMPSGSDLREAKITEYLIKETVTEPGIVAAWEEIIMLPTYAVGEEEKNPIFLEKRVYQGSSGAVYPYPVIEKISDEKHDAPYRALFLENEYLKIMILPELGGRVQMAYDKMRGRHFVYYNQVIKPALVGLLGPWISGGIEFNWPQHHRPSTYMPVNYLIEENPDGSKTVWCSEVERMFRLKEMHGFTLHPDKAYLEIKAKVYNRTPFPQTFLWWANPAVVVHDDYHSVFPPDVHAVFDHGKRDVSKFPIANGVYYKHDYSRGVDISKYKNIPVPTSYMAIKSKYDFVGGYEENVKGGLLHVADHHISPGKKQWTWGNGDFGTSWDRNLTDEDGPYIELMTGVYTDNQPDFTWLQPYEEKCWSQYFMPYAEVGYVKNASKDLIMNIEVKGGKTNIIIYSTGIFEGLKVEIADTSETILTDKKISLKPGEVYSEEIETGPRLSEELILTVFGADGKKMLSYQADKPEIKSVPEAAKAAKSPSEISSIEQLFLTGQHLEQYRHATYKPLDYYGEALRREPNDVRCNNAVGLMLMRSGLFSEAESYFRMAIKTLTERNPNPYEGEPFFNLGWSLKMQGKVDEAYEAYYKSTWNAAWRDAGYFGVAQADCTRGNWELALGHIELSLIRNWSNHKARHLKTSTLRKLGKVDEALAFANESLKMDMFNLGCLYEKYLLTNDEAVLQRFKALIGGEFCHNAVPGTTRTLNSHINYSGKVHTYMEYALDYASAGMYEEAGTLLGHYFEFGDAPYPLAAYTIGWFKMMEGKYEEGTGWYAKGMALSPEKCFPNRIEEVNILSDVIKNNPLDYKAQYYLGNFWYGHGQYNKAIVCWERSIAINDSFPTSHRNLALAYYNKRSDKVGALKLIEKAFSLDTSDARVLMELDQLYKKLGKQHAERIAFLENHLDRVEQRDDLCIERITLYNQLGDFETAKDLIASRKFHPWEGGEGKVTGQFVICCVELAKKAIREGRFSDALILLHETDTYPVNLGEGKLANAEENEIWYYKGVAYNGLDDKEKAIEHLEKATEGSDEPKQAFFYNDQQPDKIFYQGLAWRALGCEDKACSRFNNLIEHGKQHLSDICKIDYFAVSLPDLAIWEDDLNVRNKIHCYYVMALGHTGLGNSAKAEEFLKNIMTMDVNHQGAQVQLKMEYNII